MNDDPLHSATLGHDDRDAHRHDQFTPEVGVGLDRGLPELDRPPRRAIAGWLISLAIIGFALAGAVWTVHGVLVRHDAAERARRSAVRAQFTHDKVFGPDPALTILASAASATSAPVMAAPVSPNTVSRERAGAVRSYFDAPLLVVGTSTSQSGDTSEAVSGEANTLHIRAGAPTSDAGLSAPIGLSQTLISTRASKAQATFIGNRSFLLTQGTKIDCAGDTAFDSTQAGISTCTVTRNVYSDDGRVVLIERGSQINCEYRANLAPGQRRVFILSARISTPYGVIVQIDSPVADALGRMGVGGFVDNHWGERVGAAMLLGLSQDAIGYLATRGGNANSAIVYQNTQEQGSDMASRVLDQTINIAPTLKQNQGAEFTIVLARDLDFSSVYGLEPEGTQ